MQQPATCVAVVCRRAACSYTCTVDGMQQMVDETGTYDRWREAVIESTYGQLSLAPDPVVVPTLYMPPTADGKNAFSYSEAPVGGYLQQLGYDMGQDFHTVLVRAVAVPPLLAERLAASSRYVKQLGRGMKT